MAEPAPSADLVLAQAAAAGEEGAVVAADRRLAEQVRAVVRKLGESASFGDDLVSALRAHLLVQRTDGAPRIAGYAGAGPLDGWLRVTAMREAMRMRKKRATGDTPGAVLADLPGNVAPELDYLKAAYREPVRAALRRALATLDDRQQNLIRLHYGDGVGVERLGIMYRVHFSTISRWLAAARTQLFDETRRAVTASLGVDPAEFEEIMGLVQSRLDLTISLFARAVP